SRRCADTCSDIDCTVEIEDFENVRTKTYTELTKLFEAHLIESTFMFQRICDKFADNFVRLPERNLVQDEVIGEICCQQPGIPRGASHPQRIDLGRCYHLGIDFQRELDLIY